MSTKNLKFMVCCANGAGSSMMMKMTLQKITKIRLMLLEMNIEY